MSYTRYNADDLTIELVGEKEVAKALGSIPQKAPLVIRNAVNETAKDARKVMIQEAKKRYALNSKGRRHLNDLQIRQKARVSDLGAELHIGGPSQKKQMRNDLGYFKTVPNRPYMGVDVANAPAVFRGKVLKNGSMKKLTGQGNLSKGFLVKFTNSTTADANHIGMVQRIVFKRRPGENQNGRSALAQCSGKRGADRNDGQPVGGSDAPCDMAAGRAGCAGYFGEKA